MLSSIESQAGWKCICLLCWTDEEMQPGGVLAVGLTFDSGAQKHDSDSERGTLLCLTPSSLCSLATKFGTIDVKYTVSRDAPEISADPPATSAVTFRACALFHIPHLNSG